MKKILALLLATSLVIASLSACGGSSSSTSTSSEATTAAKTEAKSDAETTAAPAPAAADSEEFQLVNGGLFDYEAAEAKESSKDTLVVRLTIDPKNISNIGSPLDVKGQINTFTGISMLREYSTTTYGDRVMQACPWTAAESYEYDEDGLGMTWKMKEGIKFSDGTDMTIDDFIFVVQWYVPQNSTLREYVLADEIEKIDDYTCHVPFKTVNSGGARGLGSINLWSKAAFEAAGDETTFFAAGTNKYVSAGPYYIAEWNSGDSIVCKANPYYFLGEAKIANVRFRIITEDSVAMMEVQTGGIDICTQPSASDIVDTADGLYGESLKMIRQTGAFNQILGMNCSGALSDIRLRKAIAYATDREAIHEAAYDGAGFLPNTVGIVSYDYQNQYDVSPYNRDVEKAKALVEECGYSTSNPLNLVLVAYGDNKHNLAAEILANNLSEIGINIEIKNYDNATYEDMLQTNPESFDLWFRRMAGGGNLSGNVTGALALKAWPKEDASWETIWALGEKIDQALTEEDRKSASKEFADYFDDQCLYWFACQQEELCVIYNADLMNFYDLNQGYIPYKMYFK